MILIIRPHEGMNIGTISLRAILIMLLNRFFKIDSNFSRILNMFISPSKF